MKRESHDERMIRLTEEGLLGTENSPRWGFVYLRTTTIIPSEERDWLLGEASEMYLKDETQRKVSGDSYEGRIYTHKEWGTLAELSGQKFYAELDTTKGRVEIEFLVNVRTGIKGREIARA